MDKQKQTKVRIVGEFGTLGMKTADVAGPVFGLCPKRLTELARQGYAPHWRIDGGPPLFKLDVLKRWVKENLVAECEGKVLPKESRITLFTGAMPREIPPALAQVRPLLAAPPTPQACGSGVYFLCHGDEVVYIGQSIEVYCRAAEHVTSKKYDRWYWLAIAKRHLRRVEGGFIRLLRPKYNLDEDGKVVGASVGTVEEFIIKPFSAT